ncbi:MAG TPA: phosphatidylglycerophosphatase A [Mediterranea massiliensis]|uniref:Phosphatidylglycerophosphatase A n=1 Tax=Mediterranea massiliensis TaxID=1841865 RepID=A0A921LC15_9BACT|nr:phosphatidylglycerophosphatase A [Mediterranea massiliensis]MBM6733772.1 phosphatidylglycerophosphatase A [Mediterranea massiliensis]HJF92019.1 phosphatidylglycerophosphatase A [Mediterranea massiliensis]
MNSRPPFLPMLIGTGFGSGFSPVAPGTAGALLAALIWFFLSFFLTGLTLLWVTVALILVFTVAGVWAADRLEPVWGEDPSRVVVDEMVGVWITLLAAPAGHIGYGLAAFVLFRLFDIFKPLGIRRMESLPGGIGVMMDDILSGIYGFILLIAVRWLAN